MMTNADELLSRVAGAKYLTKIDLTKSYLQIPLSKESQKYTSFLTPWGNLQVFIHADGFEVCECNLSAAYGSNSLWKPQICRHIDWRYFGLQQNLQGAFASCWWRTRQNKRAGLTANVKKCHFSFDRIKILGHVVQNGLICPDPDKVAAIASWPRPTNKTQLKSFLGLVNFVRSYVPNYVAIAHPLTELLGRSKPDKLGWVIRNNFRLISCERHWCRNLPYIRRTRPRITSCTLTRRPQP